MDHALEIAGLDVLLESDEDPAFLELTLQCSGRTFKAAILASGDAVGEEWALRIEDDEGNACQSDEAFYGTQHGAILAAMLTTLDITSRPRVPHGHKRGD